MSALEAALGKNMEDFGASNKFGVARPVTLEWWISQSGNESTGDGSEANPWGPISGLQNAWLELRYYVRVDECKINLVGTGNFTIPSEPFDGGPFGGTGRFAIIGADVTELLTGLTAASGSGQERFVCNAAVSGGIDQYRGKTIEILTGSAAGYRRTIRGHADRIAARVATTGSNITLAGGAPDTLDGITLVAGNRVLVKDQTDPIENGIYYVSALGSGSNGTWTRASDDDAGPEMNDAKVAVTLGTANAGTTWYQTTFAPVTGSSNIVWSTSDTIATPCIGFNIAIAAGNTARIFEPAATLLRNGVNNVIVKGFQPAGASFFAATRFAGVSLVNVRDATATPLRVNSSFVHVFGCEFGFALGTQDGALVYCIENTVTTTGYNWLGLASSEPWAGWGIFQHRTGSIGGSNGTFAGVFLASMLLGDPGLIGDQRGSFRLCGGRINGMTLRCADFAARVIQTFATGPEFLIDGLITCDENTSISFEGAPKLRGTVICNPPTGVPLTVGAGSVAYLQSDGLWGQSLDSYGLYVRSGGQVIVQGALRLSGAVGQSDVLVESTTGAASELAATGDYIVDGASALQRIQ